MTDYRNSYYPPSQNLTYQNPTWTRIFLWIMHAVGWVILIPSTIATVLSVLCVVFGVFCTLTGLWSVWELVSWVILLAVCAAAMTLGLFMTGKLRKHD